MIKRAPAARRRRLLPTIAVTTLVTAAGLGLAATAGAAPSSGSPSPSAVTSDGARTNAPVPHAQLSTGSRTRYAVVEPYCDTPPPGQYRCMALRLVNVAKGTPGAKAYSLPADGTAASAASGPAGGYTPADLASAYNINPTLKRGATQTVAIVDAYDDPNALADLNAFDAHYGLPRETARSFRKVNEFGKTSPLPAPDKGWSGEIALDIEAVRAVCNKCKIILVEANKPSGGDLAQAVNAAAQLGATEISNSYGGPENPSAADPKAILKAYNHPGVVITASTGDDGWYGWDWANEGSNGASDNAPGAPASYPTVVAVGGTALGLNSDGSRQEEDVWNENGPDDQNGLYAGYWWGRQGASGGGCSWNYTAPAYQRQVAGYANTGCGNTRLAGDVAALADPYTGFDILDTYGSGGWVTIGGTSLASPLIAGMWALAGGSGGVAYPARTLYDHLKWTPSSIYDVTLGGNAFCAGDSASNCSSTLQGETTPATGNPNNLANGNSIYQNGWAGLLDCGYDYNGAETTIAANTQCNAAPGYDGPSGVGTPNGLSLFTPMQPSVAMSAPKLLKVGVGEKFTATNFHDPIPGSSLKSYTWKWGDGTSTTTLNTAVTHKYGQKGTYRITLTAADDKGRSSAPVTRTYTLGYAPTASIGGSGTVRVKTVHIWRAKVQELNTGGQITQVIWTVNGKQVATGKAVKGSFSKVGKYRLGIVVRDNSGLTTRVARVIKVTR